MHPQFSDSLQRPAQPAIPYQHGRCGFQQKRLDLVVTLQDWIELEEVDRIGIDRQVYGILGLEVPHVTIPVKPGRDIARLIEVAAMDQKLKGLGQNSALEFNAKLLSSMEPRSE